MGARVYPEPGTARRYARNIQRLDRRGLHGFVVSFTRRGEQTSHYFSDRKYGGRQGSRATALSFWAKQLLALYPPIRTRRFYARNRTGVIGVTRERYRVDGRFYVRYRASWPDGRGHVVRRSFDVKKYGRSRAFELAQEARRRGIVQLEESVRGQLGRELRRRALR